MHFKIYFWVVVLTVFHIGVAAFAAGTDDVALSYNAETNGAVFLLVVFVSLALILSFMCSVAEAVLLSITPSYIESLRKKNPQRAEILRRLRLEKVDRTFAAILTMNTIAHTVGAIEAGAQAATIFGTTWVGVFSGAMTLMILFFSEIIPKTLGTVYWPKLVTIVMFFIRSLIVVLYPLVLASEGLTRLIARGENIDRFSRDEFIAMAGIGERTGDIGEHESRIIRNLFRFRSLRVTDIMTPRTVISGLPQGMTVAEAHDIVAHSSFSRLPLYGNDLDEITGFVLKDEVLMYNSLGKQEKKLESLKRKIHAIPASASLPRLLEFLLDNRQHIVIVVDEYGGTKGLVTLEDTIETLLGMEIVDELDNVEDMRALARRQWATRVKAFGLQIDDVE